MDEPINYQLLDQLRQRPHSNLRRIDDPSLPNGVGEVLDEALAVQHLLDLIDIPQGETVYARDIDARTYIAVTRHLALLGRMQRIASWHSRETGPGGMVGDFCTECGHAWPCDTRRMADGTYVDSEEIPA